MTTSLTSGDGSSSGVAAAAPCFYSVPEAARMIGMAPVTLYRAIRDGEFPAMRVRGRLIIPARAIDAMIDAAITENTVIDASGWAVVRR